MRRAGGRGLAGGLALCALAAAALPSGGCGGSVLEDASCGLVCNNLAACGIPPGGNCTGSCEQAQASCGSEGAAAFQALLDCIAQIPTCASQSAIAYENQVQTTCESYAATVAHLCGSGVPMPGPGPDSGLPGIDAAQFEDSPGSDGSPGEAASDGGPDAGAEAAGDVAVEGTTVDGAASDAGDGGPPDGGATHG